MSAGQAQSRTIHEPTVTVYRQRDEVTLAFELPAAAPGSVLGSVFVVMSKSAAESFACEILLP